MSIVDGNIKDILSIKLKQRHDSITDQYNRIFMVKMLIVFSIITSVEFFTDKVSCIVPLESFMNDDFVHSACWIRGFYIYEELLNRTHESSYYGIPKDVEVDGIDNNNALCRRINKAQHTYNSNCVPFTKMYFLHYQYFPFYIASLGIVFYFPYLLFSIINSDIIKLSTSIKEMKKEKDTKTILDTYFKHTSNGGVSVLRFKIFATAGIKLIYLIVSITAFLGTNHMLNNRYLNYGLSWLSWTQLDNSYAFGHAYTRGSPKPGNYLLPSMGFCDITEGSKDNRKVTYNDYRILCEISTHIIYQYVLFILWFLFIISMTLSFVGFVYYIWRSVYAALFGHMCRSCPRRQPYNYRLTVREIEYLEFIRVKDLAIYKELMAHFQPGAGDYPNPHTWGGGGTTAVVL